MKVETKMENKKMTKFKEVHLKTGLTQENLAKSSGTSMRFVQGFDQGWRNIDVANVSDIVRLAHTMKCKLEDILEDEEVCNMLKQIYKK